MFTSQYPLENQPKMVKTYKGVDLSNQICHKLQMNPLYKNYAKEDIHYIVDAVQKGAKPYTQHGLKRIKRKNAKKELQKKSKKKNTIDVKSLNPQSPQTICMKALRTEFLTKFKDHKQESIPTPIAKSQKIIKRKLNQRMRRNELIRLVKLYKQDLIPHFSSRLIGHGKCPKISRKQIKDYLLSKGIVADIGPQKFNPRLTPYGADCPIEEQQSNQITELNNKIDNVLKVNLTPVINDKDFPSLMN